MFGCLHTHPLPSPCGLVLGEKGEPLRSLEGAQSEQRKEIAKLR